MSIYPWHLYLMAAMYIIAGIMHFIKPKAYLRIMPRYLPSPKLLVYLSGLAEIILGVGLCFAVTKDYAIWSIIVMLAIFLLVHFYMLSSAKAGLNLPNWVLWGRVILQFGLMYWAYIYLAL
ncbi:DoxX family protein [Leeuwenhoekiella aequorea]|uniref:Putative membrane protein n=1 Tax=Leeuwenhoekiella aequorea TaxID=283736 RepID=A0A4V1KQ82_9FLAO|nr:MauE/DoxX family redox-associated membrane protein [Leeuwenhoekiella aequorea]RXG20502.1 putative membrane protein [Leeuwenhoekiella aequorea]